MKNDLIYPIFIECCQYTTDPYWVSIFGDLAYGRTPYGVYISKGFLCCNYKTKGFSYKIEKKDPDVMFKEVYGLLTTKMGLHSFAEKEDQKVLFYGSINVDKQNWGNIRKKHTKEILIEKFILEMKNKHNINLNDARKLFSLVCIALLFKTILTTDVVYNAGRISSIDGIKFTENNVEVERDIFQHEIKYVIPELIESNLMLNNWVKYLKELRKNML